MDLSFDVRSANGDPGKLSKDDVWGKVDPLTHQLQSKGLIVARGLPQADGKYLTEQQREELISRTYPVKCPVWGDELPYKSVTVICSADNVSEVSYWLEYVHGGGSIQNILDLPDGKVALRSDYMCW